jgi:hypothetical protein
MAKRSFGLLGALMLLFASVGTSVEASAQGPGSAGPLLQESPNLAFLASSPWVEANGTWFVQLNPEAIPRMAQSPTQSVSHSRATFQQ